MTDGNTYAINRYLDNQEDWDALQEVTTELEQAEAKIVELEVKLATCKKYKVVYAEFDRIGTEAYRDLEAKLSKSEAKLKKAVEALDESVYLLAPDEKDMMRQAGVYRIVTTLAELSSVSCANLKGETE